MSLSKKEERTEEKRKAKEKRGKAVKEKAGRPNKRLSVLWEGKW